ncbi:MAG TPA: DUF5683 domain-containing protein [Longimicrobium sp.]|nr:DUF5683 domain-containing protein [Longimicrobium sp.]
MHRMPNHPAFSLPLWLIRLAVGLSLASSLAPRAAVAQDPVPADTARRPGMIRGDTIMPEVPDSLLPVSPRSAFLRSLVLPGWGQSVLGAPGRGGVYFALEAGSLWMLYKSAQKLDEAYEIERIARETGELGIDQKHGLVRERENQREDWFTLSIFWLFFSGADAFVSAHLQDFEVHVNAVPRPGGGAELRATVPVGP